jgi:hypothetical protein
MPPTGTLAFTAAHWMINRIHGHTTHMRAFAHPTGTTCFPQLLTFMLSIADLSNTRPAFFMKTANLAGWQFYQNIVALFCHQLG